VTDAVHGLARPGGYLRQHRIKLALWIAVAEGVLVLVHVLPHLAIYILAAFALAFYIAVARKYRSASAREAAWIFAASQVLTVFVPIVWHVTKLVAELAVVALAIGGLIFLFTERNRHDQA
jgi:hypothetical protein